MTYSAYTAYVVNMKMQLPGDLPPFDNAKFGAEMRRRRKDAGLSLREVARRMGKTAPFISDLERGRRNWKPEHRDKFLTAIK